MYILVSRSAFLQYTDTNVKYENVNMWKKNVKNEKQKIAWLLCSVWGQAFLIDGSVIQSL